MAAIPELLSERDRAVLASMILPGGELTSSGVTAKVQPSPLSGRDWASSSSTGFMYHVSGGLVIIATEGATQPLPSVVNIGTAPDPWLAAAEQTLEELAALQPNWNGYGAPGVPTTLIDSTKDALGRFATLGVPAPSITLTNASQVLIEWHTRTGDLEVKVVGSQQYSVYFEMIGQPPFEVLVTGAAALVALDGLLHKL